MRWVFIVIGLLLVLSGLVWTLQGLDLLGGSAMSGETTWAVIGPITAAIGAALAWYGFKRR